MSRYIDTDALIKHIKAMPWKDTAAAEISKFIFLSTVEEAPTADVEAVRHGEWIWDFNLDGDDFFRCSVCGRQEVINGLCRERNPIEEFPYCHCGAKMDGERRSDDEG